MGVVGVSDVAFGPYRLLSLLGRGGMGEVWRAHDTDKDREVAIKVLGSWLGADHDYATRFRREAALAAKLTDPHIVPVYDYGQIDDRLYMTMPLIAGEDLGKVLARQGPLEPARASVLVEQVADALDVAHAAGLVHRDVKPSNLLVTSRRGRDFTYLIDFGIAHALGGTSLTPTGGAIGTPAYMAPERFQGDGDHRGDIYALGCVLHYALTGQPPFPSTNALVLLNAHQNLPPPRPTDLRADLPRAIDAVIAHAMAKDPARRYSSAGELADATRTALHSPVRRAARTAVRPPARPSPASWATTVPPPVASRPVDRAGPPRPHTQRPPATDRPASARPQHPSAPPPGGALQPEAAPRRSRLRVALVALTALAVLVTGVVLGRAWVMQQYYVGAEDSQVVIFNGVRGSLLGLSLQKVAERPGFPLADLPETDRSYVIEGIASNAGLPGARTLIDRLRERRLPPCAPSTPGQPGVAAQPPEQPTPLSTPQVVSGSTCRTAG
jgi:serine/threonine-protein kinase